MCGYIYLHRTIQDWSGYKDPHYLQLWIHLLLSANHKATTMIIRGTHISVDLKPGQFVTSRESISKATGLHESKVERMLKKLKIEQQIEQQTHTKFRVISITKWHEYQKENNKSNNKRTTNEQQTNTDNNDKNEKKKTIPHLENAEEIFEKCWAEYPRKKGRPEAFDFFKRSVKNIDDARRLFMAIQSYKEEVEGEELKFIKYGSSFFNEKTWREYVPRDTDV